MMARPSPLYPDSLGGNSISCKSCNASAVRDCGPLPPVMPGVFGGIYRGHRLEAGHLWHCPSCDLFFRSPYASQETLNELYETLPSSVWHAAEPRPCWKDIIRFCEQHAGNQTILDVGCFSGDFLACMPNHWRKLGIEPSVAARKVAEARGVEIVADVIGASLRSSVKPSVITMIDVIEHMEYPLQALAYLRDLLAEQGTIIIFTGAADCWNWRLFGKDYWYSSLPEHVSFFTHKWFDYAAAELGMKVIACRRASSVEFVCRRFWLNFARLSLYTTTQRLRERGCPERLMARLPLISKAARWTSVPWWQEAKDHVLILLSS